MTEGAIATGGEKPAIRLERHLADPPPVVWQALTDREQLRAWFPCDVIVVDGRWEVGAAISFAFPPEVIDMTLTGEVLIFDEPKALAFTWGEETLRFTLSPVDGGTRLVLIDELPPSAAARNAAGVGGVSGPVDRHHPLPRSVEGALYCLLARFCAHSRAARGSTSRLQGRVTIVVRRDSLRSPSGDSAGPASGQTVDGPTGMVSVFGDRMIRFVKESGDYLDVVTPLRNGPARREAGRVPHGHVVDDRLRLDNGMIDRAKFAGRDFVNGEPGVLNRLHHLLRARPVVAEGRTRLTQ